MPRPSAAGMETSRCSSAVPARADPACQHRRAAAGSAVWRPAVSPLCPPVRAISTCKPVIYGIDGFA
jgi:hypothetical protein